MEDLEILLPSEGREGEISYDTPHIRGLKKKWYKLTHSQNRNRLTGWEDELTGAGEDGGRGVERPVHTLHVSHT